jgi:hypothetical protein
LESEEKQALIEENKEQLIEYSKNYTQFAKPVASTASTSSAADEPAA